MFPSLLPRNPPQFQAPTHHHDAFVPHSPSHFIDSRLDDLEAAEKAYAEYLDRIKNAGSTITPIGLHPSVQEDDIDVPFHNITSSLSMV